MAILGVRQTLWNNLSVRNNNIVVATDVFVRLGTPSKWVEPPTPPGTVWNLFSDRRFSVEGAALLGAVLGNLGKIGAQYTLPVLVESYVIPAYELSPEWTDEDGVVHPAVIVPEETVPAVYDLDLMRSEVEAFVNPIYPTDIPEGEYALDYALKLNNNSPQLFYADHIPDGWTRLEVGV